MPKLNHRLPKMCRDRNQAFSWHKGKRIYHGRWDSPEADQSYKRFITTLLESPTLPLRNGKTGEVLVSELAAGFLTHIESRMDKSHILHFKLVIGHLVELYGNLAVNDFSPKKLKVVRGQMVKSGKLCRNMVNDYTGRIIRIFAWGVEEELVRPDTVAALREVRALPKGEPGTFDNPPRQDVSLDVVRQTLPFMPPVLRAMVMIQLQTGMRPSEVYRMTVEDIDRTRNNGLWYYVPKSHKTEKYIGQKPIPLGKPEQEWITPYLENKAPESAVFSPRMAMREHRERQRAERKSKLTPSQRKRDQKNVAMPFGNVGEFYNKNSYRIAINYAIKKGNKSGQQIPNWTPYQLRHAAGTAAEKTLGLDKAQALLGHTSANTTKRYAHGQLAIAEAMARNRQNPFDLQENSEVA